MIVFLSFYYITFIGAQNVCAKESARAGGVRACAWPYVLQTQRCLHGKSVMLFGAERQMMQSVSVLLLLLLLLLLVVVPAAAGCSWAASASSP